MPTKITRAKIVDKVKLVIAGLVVFCLLMAWVFYSRSHLPLTRDEFRFLDHFIGYTAIGLYALLKHTPFRRWNFRQKIFALALGESLFAVGFVLFSTGVLPWPDNGWIYKYAGLACFIAISFVLNAVSKDWGPGRRFYG